MAAARPPTTGTISNEVSATKTATISNEVSAPNAASPSKSANNGSGDACPTTYHNHKVIMICISQYFTAFDGNGIERSSSAANDDDGDNVTAASLRKSTNNSSEDIRPATFHKMITMIFRTIFFMLRHRRR